MLPQGRPRPLSLRIFSQIGQFLWAKKPKLIAFYRRQGHFLFQTSVVSCIGRGLSLKNDTCSVPKPGPASVFRNRCFLVYLFKLAPRSTFWHVVTIKTVPDGS